MKNLDSFRRVLAIALAGALTALPGCGGSGHATVQSGSVTVLITDAPVDDLDHVFIDINRVTLISDHGQAVVFEGSERIDLLSFRDGDFLLTSNPSVLAGTFHKIRLEFSGVEVEPKEACAEVKVPSGKIDLNVRRPFEVSAGSPIFLRLDIDVEKSISSQETGQGGSECIFRPVIFVDVRSGRPMRGCFPEIRGSIVAIEQVGQDGDQVDHDEDGDGHDDDDGEGEARGQSEADDDDGAGEEEEEEEEENDDDDDDDDDDEDDEDDEDEDDDGDPGQPGNDGDQDDLAELVIDLGQDRGQTRVEIEEATAVFGADALRADLSTLQVGDQVLARGELEDDAELEAVWLVEGQPEDLKGTFQSGVEDGEFTFQPAGDGPEVQARTTPDTLVFAECDDDLLSLDMIAAGRSGRVVGVEAEEGGETFIRVAVIELAPLSRMGEIVQVDLEGNTLTIRTPEGESVEVRYDDTTAIVLLGNGRLGPEDLEVGMEVLVRIDADSGAAARIEVVAERVEGRVQNLDVEARTFILAVSHEEGKQNGDGPIQEVMVQVAAGATVLLIEDDDVRLISLSEVREDDRAVCFGVVPDVGLFLAHTVVVRR